MDRRSLLAVVLSTAVIIIFNIYFLPHPRPPAPKTAVTGVGDSTVRSGVEPGTVPADTPILAADSTAFPGAARLATAAGATEATFPVTDGARMARFTARGGALTSWTLTKFAGPAGQPVELVLSAPEPHVVIDLGAEKIDLSRYLFAADEQAVAGGSVVTFTAGEPGGLQVVQRYTLTDNDPVVGLDIDVRGLPPMAISPTLELGWQKGLPRAERNQKLEEMAMTSVALVGKSLEKLQVARVRSAAEKRYSGAVQWVGSHNKYFFAGILPPAGLATEAILTGEPGGIAGARVRVPLGSAGGTYAFKLYLGPLSYTHLKPLGMDRAVDLGWQWITPLSKLLLSILQAGYKLIPNYGVVIVLLSILIKVAFYPMSVSGLRSMKAMQKVQPEMERLRKKYADDPQKLQSAMMTLYKDNKINPVGGCLPLLLQMPVFIALYPVLANSVELRQAPFFGWIKDLSAPDVLATVAGFDIHVLPLLMSATMFWQQKLTPTDPRQAMMTWMMPIMMLFFLYGSPSGLTLYWTMLNVLSVGQQWLINRETSSVPAPEPAVVVGTKSRSSGKGGGR